MLRDLVKTFATFSKKERLVLTGATLIFLIGVVLVGANVIYKNTVIQPAEGGSYTEGIVGQPIAINPLLSGANEADQDLTKLLFADLLTLSENYATSTEGTVWTITIKDDLLWSDGEPITTNDIVFTVETIQNPETKSPQINNWQGIEATRLSNKEVQFTLNTPYSFFLENLKSLRIVPSHIFSVIPPSNLRLSTFNLEPVGSGPYVFSSYQKEKTGFITNYKLIANPNYAGQQALIEKLNIKFFSNYNDAIIAFNQKSIHGLGGVDAQDTEKLKINHSTYEIEVPRYYAIFFNSTVNPVLKETALRQALSLATNKKRILSEVLLDKGLIANGPLPPYLPGYSAEIYKSDHFSLKEAAALLEKNGWTINPESEDAMRTKTIAKEEVSLEFEIVVPEIQFLVDSANIIKTDWQNIGVNVSLVIVPVSEVQSTYVKSRNYEMLLFGNILRSSADVYSFYHSSQRFQPGLNLALYSNSKIDSLLESVREEFDTELQNELLVKIQQIIHDDYPAVFLFSPSYIYTAPQDLGGLNLDFISSPSDRLKNITDWFLNTTRVFK